MLVNTNSQNNLSNAAIKNEFEVELARFYRNSESLPVTKTVNATVSIAYSLRKINIIFLHQKYIMQNMGY